MPLLQKKGWDPGVFFWRTDSEKDDKGVVGAVLNSFISVCSPSIAKLSKVIQDIYLLEFITFDLREHSS